MSAAPKGAASNDSGSVFLTYSILMSRRKMTALVALFKKKKKAPMLTAECGSVTRDNNGFKTNAPEMGTTTNRKEAMPSRR